MENKIKIPYFHTKNIDNLTHSIDMLHIEFTTLICTGSNEKDNKSIKNRIFSILNDCGVDINALKSGEVGEYYENIEPNRAKRRYYNYQSLISYDGITVLVGRFFRAVDLYHEEREKSVLYDCESCVRLIYNPNKHHGKDYLQKLKAYLSSDLFIGRILKYDYAIDVPNIHPDFVSVFTRKRKGTNGTTQYFGERGRSGQLKIYDKSKELKMDEMQITRIEYTLKVGDNLPSDEIHIPVETTVLKDFVELTPTLQNYVLQICEIKKLGGDWKRFLDNVNKDTRKKIKPFIVGDDKQLKITGDIIFDLLNRYANEFNITQCFDDVNVDIDEFDFDLGF